MTERQQAIIAQLRLPKGYEHLRAKWDARLLDRTGIKFGCDWLNWFNGDFGNVSGDAVAALCLRAQRMAAVIDAAEDWLACRGRSGERVKLAELSAALDAWRAEEK